MTRRRDDGDPSGLPAVSPIPDAAEMEATDHYLDRLAAGAAPAPSDAAGRLLRDAAAPGEEPELAGSAAFAAAVAASVEERSTATAAPRTFTVLGRVVAAKVVAIIAIATLGLAGAGAATGAVLHAADRRSPASTTVEVVPDSEAPEAPGGEPDEDTSGRRHHPGELSLAEATERIATCDAATSAQGSERLLDAAAAADSTPAEYCAEAVAAIESTATESDTDSTTDVEEAERGAGASNGSDPAGNAAEHRDDAADSHTPAPGRSGAGSGGAANAGGNTSNSGGNANANAGGANSGGNANANAGGANAGTPNANANANAGGANANTQRQRQPHIHHVGQQQHGRRRSRSALDGSGRRELPRALRRDTLGGMCSRVQCPTCDRPTYAGCGQHVEAVLGDVRPEDRCQCERSAKPSLMSRLFGA